MSNKERGSNYSLVHEYLVYADSLNKNSNRETDSLPSNPAALWNINQMYIHDFKVFKE